MTVVEGKIAASIKGARTSWFITYVITGFVLFTNFEFVPALIAMAIIFPVSYFVFMFGAALILSLRLSEHEMRTHNADMQLRKFRDKIEREQLEIGSEAWVDAYQQAGFGKGLEIVDCSENNIGIYQGLPIHEWVDCAEGEKVRRFFFHSIGEVRNNMPVLPEEEGKIYASIDGLVYVHDVEPTNT